jgi:hypothetical protein
MDAVRTTTFEVSDVERAGTLLPEVSYKEAVEALLTRHIPERDRRMAEDLAERGFSMVLPEAAPFRPVEACNRYHGRLLPRVPFHPVVAAVHIAFMSHRPLTLSPDTIWLMITQAVANHVNVHAEELRPKFVRHQGRLTIDVRRDDFVKGSPENPWAEVLHQFSAEIRDHVGSTADLFLPRFSTTGPAKQFAAEIVLLEAMRSYFEFALHSLCGIPAITLEGTEGDWETLAEKAEPFGEFGLEKWVEVLRPILQQFARASRGDVDGRFWRSLYKLNEQSGGPVITGWITAFFPYLKDHRSGRASVPVGGFFGGGGRAMKRMLYPGEKESRGSAHGPTLESFPAGLSKAPFRWEYRDKSFDMEFLGGFVGVAQDSESLALRPEIGWAVREAPAETLPGGLTPGPQGP